MSLAVFMKQDDTTPPLTISLTDREGAPLVLPLGTQATFRMRKAGKGVSGDVIVDSATAVIDSDKGYVTYHWEAEDLAQQGEFLGEFLLEMPDNTKQRLPKVEFIRIKVGPHL